ncbi:MAG TPA: hypothetical protein VF956_13100 [Candidatus Dormibacteraeota bacterium]
MAYPLPGFVSGILATQPNPPRQVSIAAVARTVLVGADGALYAGGGAFLIAFGLSVFVWPNTPASNIPGGLVMAGAGVLCGLVAVFRIWQVAGALRHGDAEVAEVVDAEVGRARLPGMPWGEPLRIRMVYMAARGTYLLTSSGETGGYYMQQRWALALQPGARIWVLRNHGRDVLYAPVSQPTGAS